MDLQFTFFNILFLSIFCHVIFESEYKLYFGSFSSAIFSCKIYILFCKLLLASEPLHAANRLHEIAIDALTQHEAALLYETILSVKPCVRMKESWPAGAHCLPYWFGLLCFLSQGAKIKILKSHGWLLPLPWVYHFPDLPGMWCLLCVCVVVWEFWSQAIEPGRKNNHR